VRAIVQLKNAAFLRAKTYLPSDSVIPERRANYSIRLSRKKAECPPNGTRA
jgi:hypothetical protein